MFRASGMDGLGEKLLYALDALLGVPHKVAALGSLDLGELVEVESTNKKIAAAVDIVKIAESRKVISLDQRLALQKPQTTYNSLASTTSATIGCRQSVGSTSATGVKSPFQAQKGCRGNRAGNGRSTAFLAARRKRV